MTNIQAPPDNWKTILLVEPDNDVRPLLKENLQNRGYQIVAVLDAEDAIQRAKHIQSLSLILINQMNMSIEDTVASGQAIRREAGLSSRIPAVIMAEWYDTELEGQTHQVSEVDYVAYLEDGQQLIDLLADLCFPADS